MMLVSVLLLSGALIHAQQAPNPPAAAPQAAAQPAAAAQPPQQQAAAPAADANIAGANNQKPAGNDKEQHLISFEACREDIHKLCNKDKVDLTSDIAIIECLQDAGFSESATLTQPCEELVWQFKVKLTQDERFIAAAQEKCSTEMSRIPAMAACAQQTQPGYALSCLMEFTPNVTRTSQCFAFLVRTERLAFSDFRLVGPFISKCDAELKKFKCNALTPDKAHNGVRVPHTQGMALECMIQKLVAEDKTHPNDPAVASLECRHEVMRLAEMQSEDFNLDRPLYFACRQDRERFCAQVQPGGGRVFECLLHNRANQFMEPECARVLAERASMMGRDYRMAHPLTKACEAEMKTYKCEPQSNLEAAAHFHLTWILLCLENGVHSLGKENPPSQTCQHEMLTHRQLMLTEFRMAPEVVMTCAKEIDQFCSPRGDIEAEGRTLHCLMEHAQARDEAKKIGNECMQALSAVVKTADIGSNYKVDKVLYASCRPLIDGPCASDSQSEAATLSCLMKNVDSPQMPAECEKRLLEVQYFFARDWSLDPQLYEACHSEAVSRCSAIDNWHQANNVNNQVDPGPAVLACLYRSAYDEEHPLSPKCGHEVQRILHMRAVRVNLIPDIENSCRDALSEFCSHNVQPMEEMNCLQQHMDSREFLDRHPDCHKQIMRFTEMEAKDTRLNRALTKACRPVIEQHCTQYLNEDIDHGDVMECLLNNKDSPTMTNKCKSYVNHFELLSMRNYHFSYRFQKACSPDITHYCPNHNNDKAEIIRCLSSVAFEHRVLGTPNDLSKECRKQLKTAYLQQEQVNFDDKEHMKDADPQLMTKCQKEVTKFQCDRANTFEEVIECLRMNFDALDPDCKSLVFQREKIEAIDNTMDDELQRNCKFDSNKFCGGKSGENVMECLSNVKIVRLLQPKCRKIVEERMLEAARDVRLRPGLLQACHEETKQYCPEDYRKITSPEYQKKLLEGVVVNCLREKFRKAVNERVTLSPQCQEEISNVILQTDFDIRLDPILYNACRPVINQHCTSSMLLKNGNYDTVLECLKAEYYTGAITHRDCSEQLALRTQEAMVDIHLDPSLHEACAYDIQKFCNNVPAGQSRIIACLVEASDSAREQMSQPCRTKIVERNRLWQRAHKDYNMMLPGSLSELAAALESHPHRTSLIGWFLFIVFVLFCVGCLCGRVTKRVHRELKNR